MATRQTFTDVACTVCGCVCDDLRVTVEDGRVVAAEGACRLSEPWFLGQGTERPPQATLNGRPVPREQALAHAAGLLAAARAPLIYGLSRSSTPGQRAAVRLAETLGATIDTTASRCHAPSILALQAVGESTCTLGEVKNRADLVVYWGSDPAESHPRHTGRYSLDPVGLFVPNGRRDRHLVVVDTRRTETALAADTFLPVRPGGDYEVLRALLGLVRGLPSHPTAELQEIWPILEDLARRLTTCQCSVLFFGLGLARGDLGHRNVEALLQLATAVNRHARCYVRRMRIPGDVAGADSVLAWQTGYPFCVNLARGYPRYNPGEFSANDMLERRETDLVLLVGSGDVAGLSESARGGLAAVPVIALDPPRQEGLPPVHVRMTTGVYGIDYPSTAYRMDEVPIPLRAVLPPRFPSDEAVLDDLRARVGQVPRAREPGPQG